MSRDKTNMPLHFLGPDFRDMEKLILNMPVAQEKRNWKELYLKRI